MATNVQLRGFEEFTKYADSIDPNGPPVLFYFSGSKLPDGNSWCPDCVEEIMKAIKIDMVNKEIHTLNNYDEFNEYITKLPDKKENIYFMFAGKQKENGGSWCIYYQMAEPIVKAFIGELQKEIIFVYVDVGEREYWKDKACPFRTDPRSKLMVIPTIIKWKGVQRLEGSQCNKRELLQMLFEDDD